MKKLALVAAIFITLALVVVLFLPQHQTQAGTPDDSYTIERYYYQYEAQETTASKTFVDTSCYITFTPPTTKNYLILASATLANGSAVKSTGCQVLVDATTICERWYYPPVAGSFCPFGTADVQSLTGGSSYTIKFQIATTAGGTAQITNQRIMVIEVSNYEYQASEADSTTTQTDYTTNPTETDKVTLTFAPSEEVDYLIIANMELSGSDTVLSNYVRLTYDGNDQGEVVRYPPSTTTYRAYIIMRKVNLDTTSHTFIIQFHATTGGTAHIRRARIIAVKLSDIGVDVQYNEDESQTSTDNATYQDKVTKSFTPTTRGDYLAAGFALLKGSSITDMCYENWLVDATQYAERILQPSATTDYVPMESFRKFNFAASSHPMKIQYKTGTAGVAVYTKNARVLAVKIDTAESYSGSGHITVSDNFTTCGNTAYIWAHGLRLSKTYAVGYYDASATNGGLRVWNHSGLTSTVYGNLSSEYLLSTDDSATEGTWHAVVFDTEFGNPPTYYNDAATTAGYVVEDSFNVTQAAITPSITITPPTGGTDLVLTPATADQSLITSTGNVTSGVNFDVTARDNMADSKDAGDAGYLTEWTGAAWVNGSKLTNAVTVWSSHTNKVASEITLTDSDQSVILNATLGTDVDLLLIVTQDTAAGDESLTESGHYYKIVITFTACQAT